MHNSVAAMSGDYSGERELKGQSINDVCIRRGSPKGLIGCMSVTVVGGGVNNPKKLGMSFMHGPRGGGCWTGN